TDFESKVRRLFFDLKKRWGNVPFEVVNDGEVTALAGSMSMGANAVLGLAMGTSEAVGYVTPEGNITPWLNELAFAPVDYREDAPADEWSGDLGCGVQYFSQQAVARLVPLAGIELPADMPFPEQLVEVQKCMADGDERAVKIYSTIGTYLGYSIAHYAEFYTIRKMLLLGRVTSGEGGSIIIEKANEVLAAEFPELAEKIEIVTPNEKDKRHGQAVAAASLPSVRQNDFGQ
ncbi:MAG: ROK family protein, partial [Verrucomicrobia bacterium]